MSTLLKQSSVINTNRVIALGCGILLGLLPACSSESDNPDVKFAKTTFFSMVNCSADEALIDWETFQGFSKDVGAAYRALPNDAEKAEFRKSFLIGFCASTPNLKANPESLTDWRVNSASPSETIVATDRPAGDVMLITVSKRDGKQKLSSLQVTK